MAYNQFYLAASIPQWGIFIGIACVIIGYIEKKENWMTAGWIMLILTGLTSLTFNLFGVNAGQPDISISVYSINALKTTGWQSATGTFLAVASFIFQRLKNRYFRILAVLTLLYFMLIFFQFNDLMRVHSTAKNPAKQTEQTK
jgi:hypothetical protein